MFAELMVYLFYGYLAIGAIFGVYFVGWGAARIDPEARGMPVILKVILWPASVALWPLLMQKVWQQSVKSKPKQGNFER